MTTTKNIKEINRATGKRYTAEQKIRIVLEGLRGEIPVADLCRREGIPSVTYYKWSKEFLDAGKNGLTLETKRNATSEEVRLLKEQNADLRRVISDKMVVNLNVFK